MSFSQGWRFERSLSTLIIMLARVSNSSGSLCKAGMDLFTNKTCALLPMRTDRHPRKVAIHVSKKRASIATMSIFDYFINKSINLINICGEGKRSVSQLLEDGCGWSRSTKLGLLIRWNTFILDSTLFILKRKVINNGWIKDLLCPVSFLQVNPLCSHKGVYNSVLKYKVKCVSLS